MASRSVVIEFFGMPGSGKSTLAESLYRREAAAGRSFGRRGLDIEKMSSTTRLLAKLARIVRLWGLRPIVATRSAAFVLGTTGLWRSSSLRVVVHWWYLLSLIERELAEHECVILDQGIGQALWSTIFRADPRRSAEQIVEFVGELLRRTEIDRLLVVYVRADPELVRRRLRAREDGRSPLDAGAHERAFRAAQRITGLVAEGLSRASRIHSGIELVECVNHGEVDEVVDGLHADLREHGHRGGARHRDDFR